MRSASDVLDAINGLELAFPVQKWRAVDIDLWPVYRTRLFMNVTLAILSQESSARPAEHLRRIAARIARALWQVPLAARENRLMNAVTAGGTAAVFLSDGISFARLSGKWYERIVDPIVAALHSRGQRTLTLTPLADVHIPRAMPSRFVQPSIDRVKILASLRRIDVDLPEFEAFLARARAVFGEHAPSRRWLVAQAKRVNALADWFARILSQSGATRSFVNNYYSLEGFAFVLASRRAGLVCADLQHGLQGRHHCAYGRWEGVPSNGYSTLPDEFWVWTDSEAEAINAWRGSRPDHAPVVTGNLWRKRWLDDADPLVSACLKEARRLRAAPPSRTQVLVTLSWGLASEETDKILRAASLSGPEVAWWWRLHPVEAHRIAEFEAALGRHGLDAGHVREVTDLPLYALIRAADMAVAHSSTVIQEAAIFGVPSIVTSDYGAEIHAHLIEHGMAVKATSDIDIARSVQQMAPGTRAKKTTLERDEIELGALLDRLLPRSDRADSHRGDKP